MGKDKNEALDAADDHCSNPTMEITIAAIDHLSFDRDRIEVPADTCITIWFINTVGISHDFVIEPKDGYDGIDAVFMDLANSSAVCGQASSDTADTPGKARFNIKTPKYNTELIYYCSYPGHAKSGMSGVLVVTGGEDLGRFSTEEIIVIFISFLAFTGGILVLLRYGLIYRK